MEIIRNSSHLLKTGGFPCVENYESFNDDLITEGEYYEILEGTLKEFFGFGDRGKGADPQRTGDTALAKLKSDLEQAKQSGNKVEMQQLMQKIVAHNRTQTGLKQNFASRDEGGSSMLRTKPQLKMA